MEKTIDNKVPETIRESEFGCKNCLWASAECECGQLLEIENDACKNYVYFD